MEQELTNETKLVMYHENPAHFWFLTLFALPYTRIQVTHDIFCHNELRSCMRTTRRKNRPVTLITHFTNPALNKSTVLSVNYENRRLSNCHGRNMSPQSLYNNCVSKVPLVELLSLALEDAHKFICRPHLRLHGKQTHLSIAAPRHTDMSTFLQTFVLRFSQRQC
jgi:hypothetical protein